MFNFKIDFAGIAQLDKELQTKVLEKHEDLVLQATWVEKLENVLMIMHVHVQSLLSSIERVRFKIAEPFSRLETQTAVLLRLHETCDLLRIVARMQTLSKRLVEQDALRASATLAELDELSKDADLSKLEILETEQRLIKRENVRVEKQANSYVTQGLKELNQSQVNVGIEIYLKLGIVDREINKLMDIRLQQIEQSIICGLDVNNLVPSSSSSKSSIPTNIQKFRTKLWTSWEQVLNESVYTYCAQMVVVQNVLNNKTGFLNYPLSPNLEQNSEIASLFWITVDNLMLKLMEGAAKDSSYIKQALEGEYPKLLRLHLDLHKKLKKLETDDCINKPIFPEMGQCIKQFEKAYLNRSLRLLLDSVHEIFSEVEGIQQTPSTDKIDAILKNISNELSVSLVDEALTRPVCRNIAKAISLFCQKGEQIIVIGSEATQVIDVPTFGQELNVNIANIVNYMCEQIRMILSNVALNKTIISPIEAALDEGQKLTQQILSPLLNSINGAVDAILFTMHNEDFNIKETMSSNSLYIRELNSFIFRAVKTYLMPFHKQQVVFQMCLDVASKIIISFLIHVCLIRPLSDLGRKRIVTDFKAVEESLNPLCNGQPSDLGPTYSLLRSMRPLFVSSAEEILVCPVLGQVIPYSLVLIMLFARGPPELLSPHQSVGWTISQFFEWLEKHKNEKERIEFLSGAIQKYEHTVVRQQKSHDSVYLTMKKLLSKVSEKSII